MRNVLTTLIASRNIRKAASRLARNNAGVAAVEFAMIGPVFIAIFLAIFEYGVLATRAIDLRFHANHYARAVAAQAIDKANVPNDCAQRFTAPRFQCSVTEDSLMYTVSLTVSTSDLPTNIFPKPQSLQYSAHQIKYSVQ